MFRWSVLNLVRAEQVLSKRQRRRLALHEAQASKASSSSSDKKCRCGSTTHQTTRYHDCPLRANKMTAVQDDEYCQNFAIKTRLDTVCEYQNIKQTIRDICARITRLCHFGSMFINFVVLRMLQNEMEIPALNHNFVYTCMSLVAGEGSKATQFMQDTLKQFKTEAWNEAFTRSLRCTGYMAVVSYVAKSYATFIRLHLAENLEKRTARYLTTLMSDTTSKYYLELLVKNRKSLAQHIWSKRLRILLFAQRKITPTQL
ncbi:hypothetical protein V8B55DRAFT_1372622 [Mucor lusitanicus]|uniref:Uncharacterized protein n=2 Tax=Mucor circinelloides f. lusitanicus TaxID=29924 RepID=A0A168K8G8_MUCCL|nr:hypothetical protein FB192DRAFT_1350634 [Mucor lusitanicus]OAD02111.1 hypothetical protein MUCCIDRAFT_111467 [Mucor lusitanicus CBS 277.49]